MPRHTLTYTHQEIETLVSEDAVRRGYQNVKVQFEEIPLDMQAALQMGRGRTYRAVVQADNIAKI